METQTNNFLLEKGFEFDLTEGWRKITERQFGGDPSRAFAELIQNALDSYDSSVTWKDRRIEINSSGLSVSIADYGVGLNLEKIQLLLTLGGTDKANDDTKIGRFGIGFFSIFNSKLGTRKVTVKTRCEGRPVFLEFIIDHPASIPKLNAGILDEDIKYSTKIEVLFDIPDSVCNCIYKSKDSLKNYPCNAFINGTQYNSVWENARLNHEQIFYADGCHGIIHNNRSTSNINILCHYEYIINLSLASLATGGRNMTYDLRDYYAKRIPLVPNVGLTVNCDYLNLVISRDSFYLDGNYDRMLGVIREKLLDSLSEKIEVGLDENHIVANQFILRDEIKKYLVALKNGESVKHFHKAIISLAKANVFPVNGHIDRISLEKILMSKSNNLPLYYSLNLSNLRWLGGAFKHDFILLPNPCVIKNGSPSFYDILFSGLFNDVINLDEIERDREKLYDLIKRGIISKESMDVKIKIVGKRNLSTQEYQLLEDITLILSNDEVKSMLETNLRIPINKVIPVFYEIEDKKMFVSTGILNNDGVPFGNEMISNLCANKTQESPDIPLKKDILLGLQINNPFTIVSVKFLT